MLGKNLIKAAAGNAGEVLGIEDVFSTWLYTGNSSTQTITNGIDLAGEGGLVWIKCRSAGRSHSLYDTARGPLNQLITNGTAAQSNISASLTAFNSTGFSLGLNAIVNTSADTYASWTFRKAPGFFDVVTYTGNGSNRTIAHSLGSVPGTIIVKRTDTTADWQVYHRSLANTEYMVLNSNAAKATGTTRWNSTTPTSTVFSLGTDVTVNASGGTYVAYLFAHDAGGFGDSGNESVIKCGSYTGNGSTSGPTIDLGWEPQWVMIKRTSGAASWYIYDNMRGVRTGGVDSNLLPDSSQAEDSSFDYLDFNATGFKLTTTSNDHNGNSDTYIYIAIRRGPMKTPTSGTEVLYQLSRNGTGAETQVSGFGFPPDMMLTLWRSGGGFSSAGSVIDKIRGNIPRLAPRNTSAEVTQSSPSSYLALKSFDQDGVTYGQDQFGGYVNFDSSYFYMNYFFRRAPGFFDVVAYTGTGVARTVAHNLGVAPELMIVKRRNIGDFWAVYTAPTGNANTLNLHLSNAAYSAGHWNNTTPGSTVFTLGTTGEVNSSGSTYIAYLFATLSGISKVFSFTGNGTSQTINCGFTSGARFVLVKRTDSTGNWLVADTARGIVSGNDPLLYLNSTDAEITTLDWIDPDSSGFIVNQEATANANVNGATYIGLAIA